MNPDNFEQHLQHQPPRQIPADWREEILSAAHRPSPIASRPFSIFHLPSSIFWPHPRAWAGLAAVWILIFVVNFSARDNSIVVARKSSPLTPEMRMVLKEQKMILAELIAPREPFVAEPRKLSPQKPRSDRRNEFVIG